MTPEAFEAFRERWLLPRWVVLASGDNTLPLDLDAEGSLNALARRARSSANIVIEELWPPPEELVSEGDEGLFVHEIVVPMIRASAEVDLVATPPVRPRPDTARSFPPGSEWLYAKIYVGPAYADKVLVNDIAPLVERLRALGVDRWFFLHYADPDPHLRVRFHGAPEMLIARAIPELHAAIAPHIKEGVIRRLELATYEREIERYVDIEFAESLFEEDSDAAIRGLAALPNHEAPEEFRAALVLARMMAYVASASEHERPRIIDSMRDRYLIEHGNSAMIRRSLHGLSRHDREGDTPIATRILTRAIGLRRPLSYDPEAHLPSHGRSDRASAPSADRPGSWYRSSDPLPY